MRIGAMTALAFIKRTLFRPFLLPHMAHAPEQKYKSLAMVAPAVCPTLYALPGGRSCWVASPVCRTQLSRIQATSVARPQRTGLAARGPPVSLFSSSPGAVDDSLTPVLGQPHVTWSNLRLAFARPWSAGQVGAGHKSCIHWQAGYPQRAACPPARSRWAMAR